MFEPARQGPVAVSARCRLDRGEAAGAIRPFPFLQVRRSATALVIGLALALAAWPVLAQECPPSQRRLSLPLPSLKDAVNPNPSLGDIELPMPCGGKLILRYVCVPADGYFGDLELDLGCEDCGRKNRSFMEGKRKAVVSGPFTLQDLPRAWRAQLTAFAKMGDGRCPDPNDERTKGFYYFIGKYEVSNFQWKAIMEGACPGSDEPLTADDPRPKTGISWFEAVDFTRRYTEWLLKNSPGSLPKFSRGRFGYLRLPTETEWEYAARGGHLVTGSEMNQGEFFPLNGRLHVDYAVFTDPKAVKPPEKLAWIGSKCSNPLGLFDTAGNAAEMVFDPFRFSLGSRLHGTRGGFVAKGGSYRKRKPEIMPGRREEMPFFLQDGAFRSTDLGFRIVLSAIVTPDNRNEALDQQWAKAGGRSRQIQPVPGPSKPMMEMDQGKDPISEIERLAAASRDETEKKNLLFLREVIKQDSVMLAAQKAETVKAVIWSALFTAESVLNYAIRRKVVLNELSGLEKMKKETVPESVLESLDGDIAKAQGKVSIFDAAIDYFVQSYIDRIRESVKYPEDVFETQLTLISEELSLEEDLSHSLKSQLDVFKKHVARQRTQGAGISREVVLEDIIFTTGR